MNLSNEKAPLEEEDIEIIDEEVIIEARNLALADTDPANKFASMNLLDLINEAKAMDVVVWNTDIDQFLEGFASAGVYLRVIRLFIIHHLANDPKGEGAINKNINSFFNKLLCAKMANGENQYQATSVRSFAAMISCYYRYMGLGDLKTKCPLVDAGITAKEKTQVTVKAKTFTQAELRKFCA